VLPSAIAANPNPHVPFITTLRPLAGLHGGSQSDFSLLDLDELAQSWSVWYLERGVRPRDRVAVFFADSVAYSIHFFALAQIGAISVLINCKAPAFVAGSLIDQTRPVGLFADAEHLARLDRQSPGFAGLQWTATVEDVAWPPAAKLPADRRFRHADDDPVTILHSSGTTGVPKPTIHTHRSITAGPKFRLIDFKEQPGSVMMTSLPQSHLACIAFTSYAVLGGMPLIAGFDRSGDDLAQAVAEHKPTQVMSFAHAYSELAAADLPDGCVDSVNAWISVGDAVHHPHMMKLLERRSAGLPQAAFYDRTGTTELGWGVLLKIRTLSSEREDRNIGKPVGVADVAVLRQDGTIAAPGEFGLLGARGPAVTPGYWNNSDLTYRSLLSGYWLTGDVAYRNEHGDYHLLDRTVDAIESPAGTGYSVYMEEAVLAGVPEVDDIAVVAGQAGADTVAVAVVRLGEGLDVPAEKLIAQVNNALGGHGHIHVSVLEIAITDEDFPEGVTGKVLKRQLREKYYDLGRYLRASDKRYIASAFTPEIGKEI
jgi:acyl-coenzyme A synthetase/AMP-(fatty) acid ligase